MSKPFWLPTQKGVELFPDTVRAPIKLVVKGAPPGSPLERQLAGAFAGELRQFVFKQQQAYSLSTIPIAQGFVDRGTHRMHYQNNHGQETVVLEVRPQGGEQRRAKEKILKPWDWALLDIEVPDAWSTDLIGGAFRAVRVVPTPTEPSLRFAGRATSIGESADSVVYMDDGRNHPVLAWAPWSESNPPFLPPMEAVAGAAGETQIASLKIDLTQFASRSAIVVDIYGVLSGKAIMVVVQYIVDHSVPTSQVIHQNFDPIGTTRYWEDENVYEPPLSSFWTHPSPGSKPVGSPVTWPNAVSVDAMPAAPPPMEEDGEFSHTEMHFHEPSGLVSGFDFWDITTSTTASGVDPVRGDWSDRTVEMSWQTWTYTVEEDLGFGGISEPTRDVSLHGAGGFDTPDWQYTVRSVPAQFHKGARWEWGNTYPAHVPTALLRAGVPVQSEDYALMGRLIVDPDRHSISFKPAE